MKSKRQSRRNTIPEIRDQKAKRAENRQSEAKRGTRTEKIVKERDTRQDNKYRDPGTRYGNAYRHLQLEISKTRLSDRNTLRHTCA